MWFRGLIDGDGSVCLDKHKRIYRIILYGPYGQNWSFYCNLLERLGIKYIVKNYVRKSTGHRCSYVHVGRRDDVLALGDYLYEPWNGVGLTRKRNKYLECLRFSNRTKAHGHSYFRIDPETREEVLYNSIDTAHKDGFNKNSIYACCRGQQQTHKGFQWRREFL